MVWWHSEAVAHRPEYRILQPDWQGGKERESVVRCRRRGGVGERRRGGGVLTRAMTLECRRVRRPGGGRGTERATRANESPEIEQGAGEEKGIGRPVEKKEKERETEREGEKENRRRTRVKTAPCPDAPLSITNRSH